MRPRAGGWGGAESSGCHSPAGGVGGAYGRGDRSERLAAAHAVVVLAAYFEALSETELPCDPRELELTAAEHRLALDCPEVAFWVNLVDHQATRARPGTVSASLEGLRELLAPIAERRPADAWIIALARAHATVLVVRSSPPAMPWTGRACPRWAPRTSIRTSGSATWARPTRSPPRAGGRSGRCAMTWMRSCWGT
ncbi:hypothetical protein [Streptomyces sp. NPDC060027]|uniref:NACHT N-terminal helical domain 7-containing protein n=1 Tax=Streptomyces sp. NPDC060027 TaxID=3347040 RepID=UPI003674FA42